MSTTLSPESGKHRAGYNPKFTAYDHCYDLMNGIYFLFQVPLRSFFLRSSCNVRWVFDEIELEMTQAFLDR